MKQLAQSLGYLASKSDILVVFTDCDREGEYIGDEIRTVCMNSNPKIVPRRARFSSLTKVDIVRALRTLGPINNHIVSSVRTRIELDLRTGASLTRLQTIQLRHLDSENKVFSYGACQFPTLGFIVEQFVKKSCFIPEIFFSIDLHVNGSNSPFKWVRGNLFDRRFVSIVFSKISNNTRCKVISKLSTEKRRLKPLPLRTVEYQKAMSSLFKIPSHRAMEIAERLYNNGYISYPRTETDRFQDSFDFNSLIERQKDDRDYGSQVRALMTLGINRPRKGKHDDKAHPPIHPLKSGNELEGNERNAFEYISRRFIASLSKDALYLETEVKVSVDGEIFLAHGEEMLERNYLDIFVYDKHFDKSIIKVHEGQILEISSLSISEGHTSPPSLLNESELINIMDKNGIGTDATIHEHIQKVLDRGYANNVGGRFSPTALGVGLVIGYDMVSPEFSLTKPKVRSDLEKDLQKICENCVSSRDIVSSHISTFDTLLHTIDANFNLILGSVHFYTGLLGSGKREMIGERQQSDPTERRKQKPVKSKSTRLGRPRSIAKTSSEINRNHKDTEERCECGLVAASFQSKKQGSAGRRFFVCSKTVYKCKFFKWSE